MYDLHAHILPGVDDGAKTMADAVEMARVAAEHGTRAIVATPHRRDIAESFSVEYLEDLVEQFKSELARAEVELDLLLGMENHLDLELPDDLSSGRALRINGSRYALVELPFFEYPNYVEDVLFRLQLQGITPVLAHPERIEPLQRNPDLLAGFVERGMLGQITAGSIVGHFGGRAKRTARHMLRRGLVHVIASDTHFPAGHRSPKMAPGYAAAVGIVGEEKAAEMVVGTPRAILDDRPVDIEAPRQDTSVRQWWRLWQRS